MLQFKWMVAIGCVIAVGGVALLVWGFARQSRSLDDANAVERTPIVDPASLSIYTNGEYGFSFFYPADAQASDAASSTPWRVNATQLGTAIVRIALAEGEVRIGASADMKAVGACAKASPAETQLTPIKVEDITWDVFGYDLLGTDSPQRVTSYRTVHDGTCFAVETLQPLADGTPLVPDGDAAIVIRNFTFAR